jgi:hypothetical protein
MIYDPSFVKGFLSFYLRNRRKHPSASETDAAGGGGCLIETAQCRNVVKGRVYISFRT